MSDKGKLIRVLTFISLLILMVFLLRLWQLQILKGEHFRGQAEKNRVRVIKIPAPRGIIYDRTGVELVTNAPYFIASLMPDLAVKEMDLKRLSDLLSVPLEQLSERIINHDAGSIEPVRLKEGLSFEEVAVIEARRSDFPGLIIETEITRVYPFGKTGSHIIGYLSQPTTEQVKQGIYRDIPMGAFVGQWGVESLYDKELRGTPGLRFIEVDALGRQLRTLGVSPPQRGRDLRLSVDINTQKAAEEAFKGMSGALLALNPDNGEILALVSLPSFDPNLFVHGISDEQWKRFSSHPGHPFLNRVFQSRYPPGSIFKIITAIAALQEGLISRDFRVNCKGYTDVGIWRFRCWKKEGHGLVDFHRAIVESCDVFFYEMGRQLGIDRIAKYAGAFGLEKPPGVKLSAERESLIPTTSWKQEKKEEPWYLGETFNAAIGQGYVSLTPAHAALMISAVSNGGMVYRPVLLRDPANKVLITRLSLGPDVLKLIQDALKDAVNSPDGTGRTAASAITTIAGKTGTAQVVRLDDSDRVPRRSPKDHAWFVAYAPAERPLIALSVFVEHGGHGGAAAAPIAKETIEAYLNSYAKKTAEE